MEFFFGLRCGLVFCNLKFCQVIDKVEVDVDVFKEFEVLIVDVEVVLKNVEDEVDYMVMKRVEEEKDVENLEFIEEGFVGIFDDDDGFDESFVGKSVGDSLVVYVSKDDVDDVLVVYVLKEILDGEVVVVCVEFEEEMDMFLDVREMVVVVVVVGKGSILFEDQLQLIECYVMQCLEFWDLVF